jgi:serine/threonine-protein kinase
MFASRYRIVSLLGRGAMGEVYRADDLRVGQPVAIKLLTGRGAERLEDS